MIYELDKNKINILDNSFIDKHYIEEEFKNNPYAKVLIYEDNNQIIGYLYYSEIYERIEINQIEIDSMHRNCGKGNKLLKKLTDSVEKNITLEVKINNYPAIRLYEKNGFKKVAIRKNYYNGIDGILMERKI